MGVRWRFGEGSVGVQWVLPDPSVRRSCSTSWPYYATTSQRVGNFCENLHCKITVKQLYIYNAPHCKFYKAFFHFTMRLQCIYNILQCLHCKILQCSHCNFAVALQWCCSSHCKPIVNFTMIFTMAPLYILQCIYNDATPSIVNSM